MSAFAVLRAGLAGMIMLALAGGAWAQQSDELDALFDQLRYATDQQSAHVLDQQIWSIWTSPEDPDLAAAMTEVLAARRTMDLPGALGVLNTMVVDYPDYAEGWNQRATVYFMLGNSQASLADIDKVLALEPRHFGALSGQAMIYRQLGEEALALKAMSQALEVHPFLVERTLFPELLDGITRL